MESKEVPTFSEILDEGNRQMAAYCKCPCCDEHNAVAKHHSKVERIMLYAMALFFTCFSSWVWYRIGERLAFEKIQKEAVDRGHATYLRSDNPKDFKWKD